MDSPVPDSARLPTLTLRTSRRGVIGPLAVSLLFVAGGFWLAPQQPLIGWANVVFFGLCAVVFLMQLHPRSGRLVLTPQGFTFSSLFRTHTVRWEEVDMFRVVHIGPNRLVGWTYTPAAAAEQPGRLADVNQALFCVHAALPDNFGCSPDELADVLDAYRDAALNGR